MIILNLGFYVSPCFNPISKYSILTFFYNYHFKDNFDVDNVYDTYKVRVAVL